MLCKNVSIPLENSTQIYVKKQARLGILWHFFLTTFLLTFISDDRTNEPLDISKKISFLDQIERLSSPEWTEKQIQLLHSIGGWGKAELRCRADDDEESGRGIGEDKEIKTSLVDVTEAGVYLVQNDHTQPPF